MEYKITAPNKEYNGVSAGVPFVNGTAICKDDNTIDWFKTKGYAVELMEGQPFMVEGQEIGRVEDEYIIVTDAEASETGECIEATTNEIKTMKADELAAVAAELGIDLSECKKIDEKREAIISFIKAKNAEPKVEDGESFQEEINAEQVGADEA